jgi:hypothetical protein
LHGTLVTKSIELAESYWGRPIGLLFAAISGLFVSIAASNVIGLTGAAVLFVVWNVISLVFWVKAQRLPRCPKGKIGFVVAFDCENPETQNRFRKDFVEKIEANISNGRLGDRIWFRDLSAEQNVRVVTNNDARSLRERSNALFVLFGKVRTRGKGSKLRHVVDIQGLVWHGRIMPSNQENLKKEFSELISRRIEVSDDLSLPVFEATSIASGLAAQYIIGIVLLCAISVDQAEEFFIDLKAQLDSMAKSTDGVVERLSSRIPARLAEIELHRANECYQLWRRTHDPDELREAESHIELVSVAYRNHPRWMGIRAIIDVVIYDRFDSAEVIMRKMGKREPTALINSAFLSAVRGNLRVTVKRYREASNNGASVELCEEFMDFLEWYKTAHPSLGAELSFCLGFSAYAILGDKKLATTYFDDFEKERAPGQYDEQASLVGKWLNSIPTG